MLETSPVQVWSTIFVLSNCLLWLEDSRDALVLQWGVACLPPTSLVLSLNLGSEYKCESCLPVASGLHWTETNGLKS